MGCPIMSGSASNRSGSGFTLIELLVVMALIAILLTLAFPKYFTSVEKARESVLKQDLKTFRDAIDQFYSDRGSYPANLDDLVTQKYIRAIPVDPFTNRADSWVVAGPDGGSLPGVYDVHSGATDRARDGTEIAAW